MKRRLFHFPILAAVIALQSCGHDHDHESGQHDHQAGTVHDEQGGHGHGGGIVITHFTDKTELFVEFQPFVVGEQSQFAAHFTRLSDYGPVGQGEVTVRLSGGGRPDETFSAGPSATPGIFTPVAVPRHAGSRQLQFELATPDFTTVHHVGEVRVYPDQESMHQAHRDSEEPAGRISFLKETQWQVDFRVEPVPVRELHASVPATGILRGTADGEARVTALSSGRLVFPNKRLPHIGRTVKTGEILAYIVPQASGDRDVAALRGELARAEAAFELAVSERKRLQGLFDQGAVPRKRVEAARTGEKIARADLEAARSRLETLSGTAESAGVAVRAPIDGTIAGISTGAGQHVESGDALLHIVRTDRLWLEARVSESDSLKLKNPDGAWFTTEWLDQPVTITEDNGRLVAAGRTVDPVTRTTPVIFEFTNPGGELRVGMHVMARVRTGETVRAPAVPVNAIVDDQGQKVVYVMAGGESFERRIVRTGVRDGDYIQLLSGVEDGEWVVTEGAYLIALAAAGPAEAGHGHAH